MKNVGLIGSATGKLGNTVFYSRKGVTCSRVYQPTVANPNTIRQRLARERFKIAGNLGRALIRAARVGFNGQLVGGESYYNAIVKELLSGDVITGNLSNLAVAYDRLQMSKGVISAPSMGALSAPTALTVAMTASQILESWANAANSIEVPQNEIGLVLVLFSEDWMQCRVFQFSKNEVEADSVVKMSVDSTWQGFEVKVYGFFKELPSSNLEAIPTTSQPWRFPSRSSSTAFAGVVEVQ